MRESNVLRDVWRSLTGCVLFRVNTGKAIVSGGGRIVWMQDGTAVVPLARPISLGFQMANGDALVGTSDLIGWTSIEVTADMIGKRVAIFTAVETKESGGGKKAAAQQQFINNVCAAGGFAGFAKSVDEARSIINDNKA